MAVCEIVDGVWGRRPPDSAVNVIRRHVGSLRRLLEPCLPNRAADRWLIRDAGGYRLVVDADSLDLLRFRRPRDEARRVGAEDRESPDRVVELLTEALGLWAGAGRRGGVARRGAGALLDTAGRAPADGRHTRPHGRWPGFRPVPSAAAEVSSPRRSASARCC